MKHTRLATIPALGLLSAGLIGMAVPAERSQRRGEDHHETAVGQLPSDAVPRAGRISSICFEQLDSLVVRFDSTPLGCEIIDCCPGCPLTPPIDLRISVDTDGIADVHLEVEGLPAERRPELEPAVEWDRLGVGRVAVPEGETWVQGYERHPGLAPIITPVVVFDSSAVIAAADTASRPTIGQVDVTIEQMLDGLTLSEYSRSLRLEICDQGGSPGDIIHLSNNDGEDPAVVLVDAYDGVGCADDHLYTVVDDYEVMNYPMPNACRSEVAVFSDHDAVQFYENVDVWKDAPGDILSVDLAQPRWEVPVKVWIAVPPYLRGHTLQAAKEDLAFADQLYNVNHAGIDVVSLASYRMVTDGLKTAIIEDAHSKTDQTNNCMHVNSLTGIPSLHSAKELNVYYVDIAITGLSCSNYDVIWIGTLAQPATLAHEFGHEFSLDHTECVDGVCLDYNEDGVNDFTESNIMWAEVTGRDSFTEGQCFRMNVNPTSALNDIPVRTTGPTRSCKDFVVSDSCPWIGTDG